MNFTFNLQVYVYSLVTYFRILRIFMRDGYTLQLINL